MMEFVANRELRTEPEYENKIPPLTPEEFQQLEDNILAEGRVLVPIDTWNGVIIDGHHRWKVIQKHPEIPYDVREHDFPDKWAAFDWMYRNQLGRRNLTENQRTYMIGKMYEARKNTQGGNRGNQYTKAAGAQNGHMATDRRIRQDEVIGNELGIGHNTVRRAEKFAKGIDALRSVAPEVADKVLSGEVTTTKHAVSHLAKIPPEELKRAAKQMVEGNPVKVPSVEEAPRAPSDQVKSVLKVKASDEDGYSKDRRKLNQIIDDAYRPMLDEGSQSTFDINDLVEDIEANGGNYVALLNRTINQRRDLMQTEADKELIRQAVTEIMNAIMEVRNSV